MLARLPGDAHSCRPRSDQIAHCLMGGIWHPDRGQLARPMQLRQHHHVTAVGLHPVTRAADAKMITTLLERLTHRCHILETGKDSYRFRASSEIAKRKQKETTALATS